MQIKHAFFSFCFITIIEPFQLKIRKRPCFIRFSSQDILRNAGKEHSHIKAQAQLGNSCNVGIGKKNYEKTSINGNCAQIFIISISLYHHETLQPNEIQNDHESLCYSPRKKFTHI